MPTKKWSVLVWMAGDNDLEEFARTDIDELKQIGSNDDIDIVVQLDSMSDDVTRRYHLLPDTTLEDDQVDSLGETNTGDPAVAIDFFTWAIKNYPADRYLAVIWNHGSGIDETDIYRRARSAGLSLVRRGPLSRKTLSRSRVRAVVSRRHRRALFSTTIDTAIARRAIALDDTSRDFLDNAELKKVLSTVKRRTGRRLDILGFDACLMNMIEVAYQLRGTADYIVGSEEVEPGDGWPYDKIAGLLARRPDIAPKDLGTSIVDFYARSYKTDDVTLSLLDLGRSGPAAKAIDQLARALISVLKDTGEYAAITKAVLAAQHYDTKDFIDLHDLCKQFARRCRSKAIKEAAKLVSDAINGDAGLVLAEKHKGKSVAASNGVAIYFPRGDVTVAYSRLDFARATKWDEFIDKYVSS